MRIGAEMWAEKPAEEKEARHRERESESEREREREILVGREARRGEGGKKYKGSKIYIYIKHASHGGTHKSQRRACESVRGCVYREEGGLGFRVALGV